MKLIRIFLGILAFLALVIAFTQLRISDEKFRDIIFILMFSMSLVFLWFYKVEV